MKIQNVKGGYDFLPSEQNIRNYINNTLKTVFEEYGYNSIETPILCYYDVLSDKYDENSDILNEIYKLTDQGERKLGLRYDLTVPFAKFIALNKNRLDMPFKRYEIAKVFRDGPVKVGRDREFTQCDVDVVGLEGQLIEAELMLLYIEAFKRLGIDIIIKYNSRKLMTGLILESGAKEENIASITAVLDKKEKISLDELRKELLNCNLNDDSIAFLLKTFDMSLTELNNMFANSENKQVKDGLQELGDLTAYLEKVGALETMIFTPSLARGQNYYTGNVFEVYDKKGRLKGSIGGGGRYDNMITSFIDDGQSYPAVGISFGLTSIYEILKNSYDSAQKSLIDIYIIPIDTESKCLDLATKIRNLGFRVEIEMRRKKVAKSLDYANRKGIPYVIILGEDEVKSKSFKVKVMAENKEITYSLDNIEMICKLK